MAGNAAALGGLIAAALLAAGDAPAPPADAPPSEELLLFLAEFGDAEDRFVDPTAIGAADAAGEGADDDDATTDEDDDHDPPDR